MIKPFSQIFRLIHINWVLAKHGLDNVVLSLHIFAPLRFLIYLNPWNWFRGETFNPGRAIRLSLEELGPMFVKFGQMLSTRGDLIPADIIAELSLLQDKVPPFDGLLAIKSIEEEFNRPLATIFKYFNEVPIASASIAQVHEATTLDDKQLVVKILRPNILKIIKRDLALLYTIANLAERYSELGRRLKARQIVQEFETHVLDELDLLREAGNASQLRRNFLNSPKLYVPEIYWEYTRGKVLAMERISGIAINDIAQLTECGINFRKLAESGVEIFFTQVFRDSFFHADMHPGNIFVSYEHPADPQYICVDFGIVGTLTDTDKHYLAQNLYAFFLRDYRKVAQLHIESGWVPRNTRIDEFESAIRTVCEPIFERPLKDISFGLLILRLFQTGRRFHMEVQPQLMLLQKTLLAIEGLGRQLYPELDLWSTAKPFLERWVKQQFGAKEFLRNLKDNLPFITEKLPYMPALVYDVLKIYHEAHLPAQINAPLLVNNRSYTHSFWFGFGTALLTTGLFTWYISHYLNFISLARLSFWGGMIGLGIIIVGWLKK